MKIKILTAKENQIMNVLWNHDKPLSAQDIRVHCPDLSIYSVQQVLQRLLKLNYIRVAEIGHSKNVIVRLYIAELTQPEYISFLMGDDSTKILNLTSYLIDKHHSPELIKNMEKMILTHKKEKKE